MTDSIEETSIICGLQNGDRDAWTAMYEAYSASVWRYVSRLTGADRTCVADIVQETFMVAARSVQQFDDKQGTLGYWLCGIAHNKLRNYWRTRQQQVRIAHQATTRNQWKDLWTQTDALSSIEATELVDSVRTILAQLPAEYACLLNAKYIDELSILDIQQQFGGTSDAVRSKLKRARQAFRELFERYEDNQELER